MKEKSRLLIIFARTPIKGRVKKRLAAHVGDEAALQIYFELLEHVIEAARETEAVKEIHFSEAIPIEDLGEGYIRKLQKGKDLGERMENAFKNGFQEGYQQIVLAGSDLPELRPEDIQNAFSALDTEDYVLGPAMDGGYYLIGMKSLNSELFRDISWGSSSVLRESLENLNTDNVNLLEEQRDLDTYEDLLAFPQFKQYFKNHI